MVPTSRITSPFFAETWRTAGMMPSRKKTKYHTLTIFYMQERMRELHAQREQKASFTASPPSRPMSSWLFANSTCLEQLRDCRLLALQRPAQSCGVEVLVAQRKVCAAVDQKLHHRLVT